MTNIGVTYFLLDINIAKKLNFVALFRHYSKYDACYSLRRASVRVSTKKYFQSRFTIRHCNASQILRSLDIAPI